MKLIFGGVRGSGPVSGERFTTYGGDTTSVMVIGDNQERLVLDAGSGLRNLAPHFGAPTAPLVLLMTHFHMDHLLGLPTFGPLYQRGRPLTIVGPVSPSGKPAIREILGTFMGEPYWPIPLATAGADLKTLEISCGNGNWLDDSSRKFLRVGNLEVRAFPLVHPGGCLAWRIDEPATAGSLVLATDMEWGLTGNRQRESFLAFCRKPQPVSLLIMDGHFTAAEYPAHANWGHSTLDEVAEVGTAVRAKRIVVTHHAPENDDTLLDERRDRFQELVQEQNDRALAFFARQGQELIVADTDQLQGPAGCQAKRP